MYREPAQEELQLLERIRQRKELIKKLDTMELGETILIENTDVNFTRSLYLAMKNKGKKFNQIKQVLGYTMTRLEL